MINDMYFSELIGTQVESRVKTGGRVKDKYGTLEKGLPMCARRLDGRIAQGRLNGSV